MTDVNPYRAPVADLVTEDDCPRELASRWYRLVAAIIDGSITALCNWAIMYALVRWALLPEYENFYLAQMAIAFCLGTLVFLVIHGYFLLNNAQTVGKLVMGIRIETLDGKPAPFRVIFLLREMPLSLLVLIPVAGNLLVMLDALFIFGKERRCLHDYFAETRVMNV